MAQTLNVSELICVTVTCTYKSARFEYLPNPKQTRT